MPNIRCFSHIFFSVSASRGRITNLLCKARLDEQITLKALPTKTKCLQCIVMFPVGCEINLTK